MYYAEPDGTLVVEEVGPFYSIMRVPLNGGPFQIGSESVAVRAKEGKRQPLRIYYRSGDKASEIISLLQASAEVFPTFVIVQVPEECYVDVSLQNNRIFFRLRNMTITQGFHVEPTVKELARTLEASSQFFSELDRTADFPDITQHVQAEVYELQMSRLRFPGAPSAEPLPSKAVPYESDCFTLRQGSVYGLKLTNNSHYDLYPTVQYFDTSTEFKFGMLVESQLMKMNLILP